MNYTKEQFDKLPKWAQSEITTLKNNVFTLNNKLSQYEGMSETNTYLREGMDKKPLPKNANVEFYADKTQLNKASIYVRSNGMIDVNTDSRSGDEMVILPRAANSFYITFVKL
jgi:hypothetical protein